jgi:hypothetical protein
MVHVQRAAVSLIGGIQPGVLRKAIGREHLQDGLCARLLLAMPEPKPVPWSEATVHPDVEAALGGMFERLLSLEPAADEEGHPMPFALPLTEPAKTLWVAYYDRHRTELAELDDDLAAAWSKLEAYTARFALIFQLCTWAAGDAAAGDEINETSMRSAIELSDWFGNEARRVYGLFVEDDADRERRELVELIRRKNGSVTARELARSYQKFRGPGKAELALDELGKAGLGRWSVVPPGPLGGRPARVFTLSTGDSATTPINPQNYEVTALSPHTNGHDLDAFNRLFGEPVEGDCHE